MNRSFGNAHPAVQALLAWSQWEHYSEQRRIRHFQSAKCYLRQTSRCQSQLPTASSLGAEPATWSRCKNQVTRASLIMQYLHYVRDLQDRMFELSSEWFWTPDICVSVHSASVRLFLSGQSADIQRAFCKWSHLQCIIVPLLTRCHYLRTIIAKLTFLTTNKTVSYVKWMQKRRQTFVQSSVHRPGVKAL